MCIKDIKELIKNNIIIIIILIICITMWITYIAKKDEQIIITKEQKIEEIKHEPKPETAKIKVHIIGEVENKGVYELEENARVADAIEVAGGALEDADLESINLVEEIQDGVQIKIPEKNEEKETTNNIEIQNNNQESTTKSALQQPSSAITKVQEPTKENKETVTTEKTKDIVNINTATEEELQTLTGIGPATSKKIIDYRKQNGKFNNIEEIMNVSGIGEKKYNKIKAQICV